MRPLTAPEYGLVESTGAYFIPIARETPAHSKAQDAKLAEDLWAFSETLVAGILTKKPIPRGVGR